MHPSHTAGVSSWGAAQRLLMSWSKNPTMAPSRCRLQTHKVRSQKHKNAMSWRSCHAKTPVRPASRRHCAPKADLRMSGRTPLCRRGAGDASACPAAAISTEVPTHFRMVFWVLPHPLLAAYSLTDNPHHLLKGLFRTLKWEPRSLPPGPSRVSLASPCTLRPPLRQRAARDARLARAPLRL